MIKIVAGSQALQQGPRLLTRMALYWPLRVSIGLCWASIRDREKSFRNFRKVEGS